MLIEKNLKKKAFTLEMGSKDEFIFFSESRVKKRSQYNFLM